MYCPQWQFPCPTWPAAFWQPLFASLFSVATYFAQLLCAAAAVAQLLVRLSASQVEAADRLGVELSEDDGAACAVFGLLDDVISWVERPHAASLEQQRPVAAQAGRQASRSERD